MDGDTWTPNDTIVHDVFQNLPGEDDLQQERNTNNIEKRGEVVIDPYQFCIALNMRTAIYNLMFLPSSASLSEYTAPFLEECRVSLLLYHPRYMLDSLAIFREPGVERFLDNLNFRYLSLKCAAFPTTVSPEAEDV